MTDPWWPNGYRYPAFTVQRVPYGVELGGDYVRGTSTSTLPYTALRYPTTTPGYDAVENKAFLFAKPLPHAVMTVTHPDGSKHEYKIGSAAVEWGWPIAIEDKWSEVALVRSGFGFPATPTDGETVFRALKSDFTDDDDAINAPPPVVIDQPLQRGQYYYYSLFFKTTPYDWIIGMSTSVLIPRDFQHAKHLWNTVPPFYQSTDENLRAGAGPLRNFLAIFGFELDYTRELVEQWQETYHIDKSPMPLLRQAGANFGVPYRSGVGDGRYRSMIAALPEMLAMRGTPVALRSVVMAGTKWECDITLGTNIMILPDDSDFFAGTGSWGTLDPSLNTEYPALDAPRVLLTNDGETFGDTGADPGYGRDSMRVMTPIADQLADFTIACGHGEIIEMDFAGNEIEGSAREFIPLYTGIPVEEGFSYGFRVKVTCPTTLEVQCLLLWYGAGGNDDAYLSSTEGLAEPADDTWTEEGFLVQGTAPDGAVYMVPAITFGTRAAGDNTGSPYWAIGNAIDICGAQAYLIDSSGSVSITPPDKYLTLGDPNELLGEFNPAYPTSSGFLLGDVQE